MVFEVFLTVSGIYLLGMACVANNRESTTSQNYLPSYLRIIYVLPRKVVDHQTFLAAWALTDSRTMQSILNRKPRLHSDHIAHQRVPSPSTKLSARGTSLLCGPVCSRVPRRRRNKFCFGSVAQASKTTDSNVDHDNARDKVHPIRDILQDDIGIGVHELSRYHFS